MKKILSLILALLMTVSAASFVGAAEEAAITEEAAVETASTTQYDEAISFLATYGIYKGKSATDLAAGDPIERYQMALFVARIATGWVDDEHWASSTWVADEWYDRDHDVSGFDDLEGTPAVNYLGALSYAAQMGIIEGYGNKKFGPTDGITYQDALTMVVRTLGYKNLPWPWGYIEKAVTLGLTEGIPTTVKYTDKLNRGEVAQIIYNALFAITSQGDTLAARNFNGELGWETIIITVAGRGRYLVDERVDGDHNPVNAGNDIGFRVVQKDGTLGDTTYYVKNNDTASFNFGEHKERYLGHAYKALFTKDKDSNYVEMIRFHSTLVDTVWNFGLPTKGDDGKYPITAYLSPYKLVSKFSKNTYLNTLNGEYGIQEYILKDGLTGGGTYKVFAGHRYSIDWISGNILEWNKDGNGAYKVSFNENGTDYTLTYDIAWYYNETLGQYFRFKTKDVNGNIEYVGIDILDDADLEAILANQVIWNERATPTGLSTITSVPNTAYASLLSFTIPGYSSPNYGIFEQYRFGRFNTGKVRDTIDGANYDGYIIEDLDAVAKPMFEELDPEGRTYSNKGISVIKEGANGHYQAKGFISEDGLTPTSGDYVIYSYDRGTGEIKVVKIIYKVGSTKEDKDNFVATGVVRAYNTNSKTVTIGENQYSYDYQDLAGNPFWYSGRNDKTWGPIYKAAFTRYFKSLFNQYVNYVVVDGKLVWVERANVKNELIIVDSYAGLSSDGYIVVNGYDTKDLVYRQYRIGSYNGWVKGDYYYYLTREAVEDSFQRGSLYRITSYDDVNDVYYVYTVAKVFMQGRGGVVLTYDVDELAAEYAISGAPITIAFQEGYRTIDGGATYQKTAASDMYVLICNPIDTRADQPTFFYRDVDGDGVYTAGIDIKDPVGHDYAPIIVYKGKPGRNNWTASGWRLNGYGDTTFVLLNVDFNTVVGFNADQYDLSFVLFLHYDYETAAYDGADADGWYLLGASSYTARVFNYYNGEIEVVTAVNKDLKMGYSYTVINGVVVNDDRYGYSELDATIPGAYQYQFRVSATNPKHYLFGAFWGGNIGTNMSNGATIALDGVPEFDASGKMTGGTGAYSSNKDTYRAVYNRIFDRKNFSKWVISNAKGLTINVDDLVDGIKLFWVTPNADGERITEIERIDSVDTFRAWVVANNIDVTTLYFWWIYNTQTDTVVVYVQKDGIAVAQKPVTLTGDNLEVLSSKDTDIAKIEAKVTGIGTYVEDQLIAVTLDSVEFIWTGKPTTDTHYAVDLDDFHFGSYGYCDKEDWNVTIQIDADPAVRIYDYFDESEDCIITGVYDPQLHDETFCELIQSIKFKLPKKITVVGITNATAQGYVDDLNAGTLLGTEVYDAAGNVAAINLPQHVITVNFTDSNDTLYTLILEAGIKVSVEYNAITGLYRLTGNNYYVEYLTGSAITPDNGNPNADGIFKDFKETTVATTVINP